MNKAKEEVLEELKICLKGNCEECDYEHDCDQNIASEELIFKNVVELLERYEMANRPMITEDDLKLAHAKGMEEAWEVARRITLVGTENGYSPNEFNKIFKNTSKYVVFEQPIRRVLHHIKEWEEAKKICAGDVVEWASPAGKIPAVVTKVGEKYANILLPDGMCGMSRISDLRKIGKTIDLKGLFKQIGE